MSKVIIFSRTFPAYHPKAGKPTYFVEKIYNSIGFNYRQYHFLDYLAGWNRGVSYSLIKGFYSSLNPDITNKKHHTIRAKNRFNETHKFSPRIWSGKPYHSPQIIIMPDMEVKKVWDFEIKDNLIFIDNNPISIVEYRELIARNDGLNYQDFKDWFRFPEPFSGQIICWDENLNY